MKQVRRPAWPPFTTNVIPVRKEMTYTPDVAYPSGSFANRAVHRYKLMQSPHTKIAPLTE